MTSTAIETVKARRVWDSRGRPTVEAEIILEGGASGRAIAPSGASTGSHEALELRDGGPKFAGLGVDQALNAVRADIAPALAGFDAADQAGLDRQMIALDGTDNKTRLGANATIAVSMAAAHAAAAAMAKPLWAHCQTMFGAGAVADPVMPLPEIQIFGGGAHAGARIDIQDLMVVCPGAASFDEALCWTAEIYLAAGALMRERGALAGVADEGGYWPAFSSNESAIETLVLAIERAGFRAPDQVGIALDVAATEFYDDGRYQLALDGMSVDRDGMVKLIAGWLKAYPILSVEDPLSEHDADGFMKLTRQFGQAVQIVGDDLLVSDAQRTANAAKLGLCNSVLLKPNQRGTLSELFECWQAAKSRGMSGIISARSGETEDITIAHLAVGWGVPQFKVGSFSRSERMAKWNEVLRIEEALGGAAGFAGHAALKPGPRLTTSTIV